jgi:hypothetical protein
MADLPLSIYHQKAFLNVAEFTDIRVEENRFHLCKSTTNIRKKSQDKKQK